jgi:hypothetical protein
MVVEEYVELKQHNIPQNGLFKVVVDHFWLVSDEGVPLVWCSRRGGRGLQCNKDESIMKSLCKGKRYKMFPVVFVPISVDDFEYNL